MIASKGGASEPLDMLMPGKAGGTAAVGRTLASTICRIVDPTLVARPRQLHDASAVMRFQPAHQSMINRRYDGRAPCLARQSLQQMLERSHEFTCLLLAKADMKVDEICRLVSCLGWSAQGGNRTLHLLWQAL